nr:hypothetical protein [Tanacetum cinerariifolium]
MIQTIDYSLQILDEWEWRGLLWCFCCVIGWGFEGCDFSLAGCRGRYTVVEGKVIAPVVDMEEGQMDVSMIDMEEDLAVLFGEDDDFENDYEGVDEEEA